MIQTSDKIPNFQRLNTVISDIKNKLADYSEETFWIAGGAITSCVTNEKINDYDVFSPNPDLIIDVFLKKDVPVTFETEHFTNFKINNKKIQVIRRYKFNSPSEIFDNFDFTIVCGAYDGENFYCHDRFWQDIANRRLVINGLSFPLKTLERVAKYSKRGYTACPFGLLKIAKAIHGMKIDWDNPDENQLSFYPDGTVRFVGVD